jgi:tripartite-type tricarboxylate transporter receptor subunit TctC
VVENRAGAGTVIGSELVAKASPDGYTLLLGTPPLTINPALYRKLPFDALRDFTPIALAATAPSVLIVHPSVPVKSVKEMIALAKARPGEILFGSGELGTHSHLAIVLFAAMAQIRMLHVPYKSGAPSLIDLIAGNIALTASGVFTAMPYVHAGRVRVLGVTSASSVPMAPEIPTVAEAGVPGYESVQWYGLLAPAGTPRDIVGRLNRETVAVLRTPSNRERITADGADVVAGTPEEFASFLRTDPCAAGRTQIDGGRSGEVASRQPGDRGSQHALHRGRCAQVRLGKAGALRGTLLPRQGTARADGTRQMQPVRGGRPA